MNIMYNATFDIYRDGMYHGGIFSMGFLNGWASDIRANAAISENTPPRPGGVATDMLGSSLPCGTPDHSKDRLSVLGLLSEVMSMTIG